MIKYHSQYGAMIALALLGLIDNISTIIFLGRYSLTLVDNVLFSPEFEHDEATFLTVLLNAIEGEDL